MARPSPSSASSSAAPELAEGLRWVSAAEPGISRRPRAGRGAAAFDYRHPGGGPVHDAATLARIRRLAIPPAWTEVWICRTADGHLQATGRDAKGRKQYRYHADWQRQRGRDKFEQLRGFGAVLPRIRAAIRRRLAGEASPRPSREGVLAAVIRLLDATALRIGNPEYARRNRSFGLSTLRCRHAGVQGDELRLRFVGKAGVVHDARLNDPRLAALVRRCRELPGHDLFQFVDGDGAVHAIGSGDVNRCLRELAGGPVTAKDFRTWHGSVQALDAVLQAWGRDGTPLKIGDMLAAVARQLGNTPAVCRKAYVHPRVLALATQLAGGDAAAAAVADQLLRRRRAPSGLSAAESRLLALLARPARRGTPLAG